jgi:colicin import membrane protein
MARKLKAYQTSSGFYDVAVAAPSMKAAAEAWGSRINVFKQGFAKETRDPAIVAATLAKPGVVLRRPVGSNSPFAEHAELPKDLSVQKNKPGRQSLKKKNPVARNIDAKAARAAALAFEIEHKRRENARRKEEIAREKNRKRREQAIATLERALEQAKREHETKMHTLERDRAAFDRRLQTEEARWERQKEQLEAALRRASD